jgi:hypothetical protein
MMTVYPNSMFQGFRCYNEAFGNQMVVAVDSLAMGRQQCFRICFGQQSQTNLLRAAISDWGLGYRTLFPRGNDAPGLIIAHSAVFCFQPLAKFKGAPPHLRIPHPPENGSRAQDAYKNVGLIPHEEKVARRQTHTTWGGG